MPRNDSIDPGASDSLLPIRASQMTVVAGLPEAVQKISADSGIDYLSDADVGQLLDRHLKLSNKMNSRGMWGGLLLGLGAFGAWFLLDTTDWNNSDLATNLVPFAIVALLFVPGTYLVGRAFWLRRRWVRSGTRDQMNGYLRVLSTAESYGVSSGLLPAWLKPPACRQWR